ncbi:Hypothetical predicted protein [Paramuricea clavata]|uniref:Uncharacterized protein n=1 Tax=Paramuricea clavata TaxID=317549 RepID=A0A6S7KW14_PARCT|nr:Hypothetical predicted protein [Paramuricea clavata]
MSSSPSEKCDENREVAADERKSILPPDEKASQSFLNLSENSTRFRPDECAGNPGGGAARIDPEGRAGGDGAAATMATSKLSAVVDDRKS